MSRPLVIAHRGASGHHHENSLAAFRAAGPLGADAVELDVHETADGAFVVLHSTRVVGRHISQCRLREIRQHRLPNGEVVPTLEEALAVILPGMTAYVETKRLSPERDERLFDVFESSAAPQRVGVHSFDHRIICRLGEQRPLLRRGVISASYPVDPVRCMEDADASILWQEWTFVDEQMVQSVHGAGLTLYAWTLNDPEQIERLARLGVDGICTDFPEVARRTIDGLQW